MVTPPEPEPPQMESYGLELDSWEGLPWSWASDRLTPSQNYWLISVDTAGAPHSLPVWGVWSDEVMRFGYSCAGASVKARNVRANPHVAFTPGDTVECVSVNGTAEEITGTDRVAAWIDRYLAKYQPIEPMVNAEFLLDNAFFEVTPTRALAVIERPDEFTQRATRWRF